MKPDQRIKQRVKKVFDCRNLSEVSRRTGYPRQTLSAWKNNPLRIRAVDLETLEDKLKLSRQDGRTN